MDFYLELHDVTLGGFNGDCGGMVGMTSSPGFLVIYCVYITPWWQKIEVSTIFLEVSSWALVSCDYNNKWINKEVGCCFGSGLIIFLIEASHKFDSWPSVWELEENFLLFQDKKHLSQNYFHWIQHLVCGGMATVKVWMGHYCDLYPHKNSLMLWQYLWRNKFTPTLGVKDIW